jgi:hypothetical protein
MDFLSSTLVVRLDPTSECLLISHPDSLKFPEPLVTIRKETYSGMNFEEATAFVGSRILLLIPGMREHFKGELNQMASTETGKGFTKRK